MAIAHFIDHTLLKPTCTLSEIETLCSEATQYGFAAVCVPPYFVADASKELKGSTIKTATVIGFPFGYSHYKSKEQEVAEAIEVGAQEVDMVINLAAFRSNDLAYLETEIDAICQLTKDKVVLKLIIESGILSPAEIIRCCELYAHYPIQFMKTSTGYAEKGASVDAVSIMRANLPSNISIKASGGIRTYTFAKSLIDAGATRLGCSASIAIVNGEETGAEGY